MKRHPPPKGSPQQQQQPQEQQPPLSSSIRQRQREHRCFRLDRFYRGMILLIMVLLFLMRMIVIKRGTQLQDPILMPMPLPTVPTDNLAAVADGNDPPPVAASNKIDMVKTTKKNHRYNQEEKDIAQVLDQDQASPLLQLVTYHSAHCQQEGPLSAQDITTELYAPAVTNTVTFSKANNGRMPKSARVIERNTTTTTTTTTGTVLVYYTDTMDAEEHYLGNMMPLDGCVDFFGLLDWGQKKERIKSVAFVLESNYSSVNNQLSLVVAAQRQKSETLQQSFATADLPSQTNANMNANANANANAKTQRQPHTRIVFSATSSDYMTFQVQAHAYSFLEAAKSHDPATKSITSWTRLLSAQSPDDLAKQVPTFTAPPCLYASKYSPTNKPDIIDKWFRSDEHDAPHPDDIIVVLDPDSWLVGNHSLVQLHKITHRVKAKQAVGQTTYYSTHDRRKMAQRTWEELCFEQPECQKIEIDPVGVPYVVKASDLKDIAPLWRQYTMLLKEQYGTNATFRETFDQHDMQLDWCSEMLAYNFACAHLNIKTVMVRNLQVRDFSKQPTRERKDYSAIPTIHTWRAWFPPEHAKQAEQWRQTGAPVDEERKRQPHLGVPVWDKRNATSATIQPWPLPIPTSGMDYVSYHTLRLLHESKQYFGGGTGRAALL